MKTRSGKRLYMTLAAIEAANNRPTKRRAGMKEMSVPVLCDITPVQAAKRLRKSGRGPVQSSRGSPFDCLPDDLLIDIFSGVSNHAASAKDLGALKQACRRFAEVATHPRVFATASTASVASTASNWSEGAQSFLKASADAGNMEAAYRLGLIYFYCLGATHRTEGIQLLNRAAVADHPAAVYAIAVIHFNGSGGAREDKDLVSGVTLCARAALLGHLDAVRELGHCLQHGYGLIQDVPAGRKLLQLLENGDHAAATEKAMEALVNSMRSPQALKFRARDHYHPQPGDSPRPNRRPRFVPRATNMGVASPRKATGEEGKLDAGDGKVPTIVAQVSQATKRARVEAEKAIAAFKAAKQEAERRKGLESPGAKKSPRGRRPREVGAQGLEGLDGDSSTAFMVNWFKKAARVVPGGSPGLRLCSHEHCGRVETRRHEFRRCSACGSVNYCSTVCQERDWKARHRKECTRLAAQNVEEEDEDEDMNGDDDQDENDDVDGEEDEWDADDIDEEDAAFFGF